MSGWLAARTKRSEAERIVCRLSDELLEELGPIDLGGEAPPEDEQRWQLAADLDYLQSCFAGSMFWKLSDEGRVHRVNALREIEPLLAKAKRLHLLRTAERLDEIARALHAMR